jgi:hypothetical protein
MKLTPRMLRSLIKEAIQSREPGSPLWPPEKMKRSRKTEAFGPYSADPVPYNPTGKGRRAPREMQDDNFENARRELFSQALDSVIEEFVETAHEYFHTESMSGPDEGEVESEIEYAKEGLREELLQVISKYLSEFTDDVGATF